MTHKKSFFEKIISFLEGIILRFGDDAIPHLGRVGFSKRSGALVFIYSMVSFFIIIVIIAIAAWMNS